MIRKAGRYRTCDLYEYLGQMFVKYGADFVRLNSNGSASLDGVGLDFLAYQGPLFQDKFGRLCVKPGDGYKALTANPDGTVAPLMLEGPT